MYIIYIEQKQNYTSSKTTCHDHWIISMQRSFNSSRVSRTSKKNTKSWGKRELAVVARRGCSGDNAELTAVNIRRTARIVTRQSPFNRQRFRDVVGFMCGHAGWWWPLVLPRNVLSSKNIEEEKFHVDFSRVTPLSVTRATEAPGGLSLSGSFFFSSSCIARFSPGGECDYAFDSSVDPNKRLSVACVRSFVARLYTPLLKYVSNFMRDFVEDFLNTRCECSYSLIEQRVLL